MVRFSRLLAVASVILLASAVTAFAEDQTKSGKIKSVDATAKTFVLGANRDLTVTVNDKTTFTLDGNASTFADAVKVDATAVVTYSMEGKTRVAGKVEVTSVDKKK
jgi:hypothetical protein